MTCLAQINIESLQSKNIVFILDTILNRLRDKHITINILISEQIPADNFKAVFSSHRYRQNTTVAYKFVDKNFKDNYLRFLLLASSLEFSQSITLDFSQIKEDK